MAEGRTTSALPLELMRAHFAEWLRRAWREALLVARTYMLTQTNMAETCARLQKGVAADGGCGAREGRPVGQQVR